MKRFFALLLMLCMFISLPVYASAVDTWRDLLDEWNSSLGEDGRAYMPLKPLGNADKVTVYDYPGQAISLNTITAEELSQCDVQYLGYIGDVGREKYFYRIFNSKFTNNYVNLAVKFVAADSVEQVYEAMPSDRLELFGCDWNSEGASLPYHYTLDGILKIEEGLEIEKATAQILDMESGEIMDSTPEIIFIVPPVTENYDIGDKCFKYAIDTDFDLASDLDFSQLSSDASYVLRISVTLADPRHYFREEKEAAHTGRYSFERGYFQKFKMKDSSHGDGWSFDDETGTLYITAKGPMPSYNVYSYYAEDSYHHVDDRPWANFKDYIRKVVVRDTVTSISANAFQYCRYLTDITIPEGVTSIGDSAFLYCDSLTDISIPEGVTSIGDYAFMYCYSLTDISIPEGVTSIGDYAFMHCESLTDITIPEGVTSIGDSAFEGCVNLTDITIPGSVTSILDTETFAGCSSLTGITVSPSNPKYCDIDGVVFSKDKTTLWLFPRARSGKYSIPKSVTSIRADAFRYCKNVSSITIPGSVTSISAYEFSGCDNLTDITVAISNPEFCDIDGVLYNKDKTTILCFPSAHSSKFSFPEGVTSIGYGAFGGCVNLTDITIPEGVTYIGSDAFFGCINLTGITIPRSVTVIGFQAFAVCSSLNDVYFRGTDEEWSAIYINDGNESLTNAKLHILSMPDLILPAALTLIEEAFMGTPFTYIKLSENTVSVGPNAFANCPNLLYVEIPAQTTQIDAQAFGSATGLTIFGKSGSAVETFANTHGYTFMEAS